jgi:hypothetical protein
VSAASALDQSAGTPDVAVSSQVFQRLRLFNLILAAVHAIQGVAILLISTDFALPVTTSFLVFDEEAQRLITEGNAVFDLRIAPLVASFLFLSAIAHLAVAAPGVFPWYVRNLRRGINYARWWEYSASASLMMVIIAMLAGMYDLPSLILIFTVTAAMILFGLVMEVHNQTTDRVNWTSFWLGSLVGVVPWIVVGLYLLGPGTHGPGDVPGFVYGIYFSLFVWFTLFPVNMWLQYRRIGPWRDYLFGERAYILLSLTAKSLLAWQTFAGTLRDV